MWTDVFCRKVKIEVKGPKDHKLVIIKSSTPGKYAKKPRVFWGGDNKTMPASFSNSALLMSYVIIATVHDGNGEVLETFNLPNSFLPYKQFVFHLEAPYRFDKIPITCWLEDLLRFFVRRKKSQEPDNIPTVNGSRSCEMNGGHLLSNTDESHQSSSGSSQDLSEGGSYTFEINGDHLLLKNDVTDQSSLNDFYNREMNGDHLLSETDDTDLSSSIENSSPQMSPNSVYDTAFLLKSLNQRTDEICERGSSSNHTPYYDADTSPFCDSDSPHSSHVPLNRSARNMGSRSLSEIFGNTWKELKGIMDLQGG